VEEALPQPKGVPPPASKTSVESKSSARALCVALLAVVLRTNFRTASYEPVASQGLSASGMVGWLAFDTFDATEA